MNTFYRLWEAKYKHLQQALQFEVELHEYLTQFRVGFSSGPTMQDIKHYFDDSHTHMLFAGPRSDPCAYSRSRKHNETFFFERAYVLPSFQGMGLGRVLAQEREELAKRLDCTSLCMEVHVANISTRAFYSKLGFTEHETNDGVIILRKAI